MLHTAHLRGWLWLPYTAVADLDHLKKQLVFKPPRYKGKPKPDPVLMYYDDPARERVGVPQAWGFEHFGRWLDVVDETTTGQEVVNPGSLPTPLDDRQAKFMAELLAGMQTQKRFVAKAPTGSGKTVSSLWAAHQVGRKTLILVHLDRLKAQWIKEIRERLGIPRQAIGEVAGDKCIWHDRDYVVGMLQSVAYQPLRYPVEFYRSFGTVIYDEVHRCGAPVFSQAVWQFPAAVRLGLSATVERRDGADVIFRNHLGELAVTSTQEALPLQVWPIWYESQSKLWGENHGARIKCLSLDRHRNERIAGLVKRMYDSGRQAIIVAEGIVHLQTLMHVCAGLGIPKEVMGQFTAQVHDTRKVRAGDRMQEVKKMKKQSAGTLERIKENSQLIFATYGMIKEGIDIPRLDAGIDATPRSDATQLIGRIRRPHPGKKEPILWITMVDVACNRSLRYYQQRLAEYTEAGAEVVNRQ